MTRQAAAVATASSAGSAPANIRSRYRDPVSHTGPLEITLAKRKTRATSVEAQKLPAGSCYAMELPYHWIKSHEEAIDLRSASRPNYDPTYAQEAVASARRVLDGAMDNAGVGGNTKPLIFAAWDRGLEPDAINAVRSGIASKLAENGQASAQIKDILRLFMMDSQYMVDGQLLLYGGAALCLHTAQSAGLDPMALFGELTEEVETTLQPAAQG